MNGPSVPARPVVQAIALTLVAGIADAVGYMTMGGVFAANMTGNTVLAGIGLARGDVADAWHHLAPLLAFFLGAMLSRLLLKLGRRPAAGLLVEAALLAAVGFLPIGREAAVVIVALAMGIQAAAVTQFAGHSLSTVVVTSTLARTAEASLDLIWPGLGRSPLVAANPRLLALTWVGYLAGAAAGALLVGLMPYPLLVPAALLLLLLALAPTSVA